MSWDGCCGASTTEKSCHLTGYSMLLFDVYENPRGTTSCQGKVGYRGPVSPKGKNAPRIKLDLSTDEVIVQQPVISSIYHPYSDAPATGIHIRSYSYEETFGEKIRALAERTRPRDLYDVINLFRNDDARPTSPSTLGGILGSAAAHSYQDIA